MTVRELIEILETFSNKETRLVIDCPRCKYPSEVRALKDVILIEGDAKEKENPQT